MSTQALQFGKTIQLSAESDDGFSCSASGNVAYTYGPNGEFGCATTTCSGWGNNTCITPGVSGGFFNDFEDVDGPYVIQVFSASLRSPISGSIGIIESFDGRQIGWVIGVLADSNLMPFDVAAMSCRATMVRPERDGKKTKQTVKASVRVEPIHHHAVYLFVLQRKRTVRSVVQAQGRRDTQCWCRSGNFMIVHSVRKVYSCDFVVLKCQNEIKTESRSISDELKRVSVYEHCVSL